MRFDKFIRDFIGVLSLSVLFFASNVFSQATVTKFSIDTNKVVSKPNYWFFRIDVGGEYYRYQENTKRWLGNLNNANISFYLKYNKIGVGLAFKPTTTNPYQTIVFNDEPMTHFTKLNVINTEYVINYSLDFPLGISVEPLVGINRVNFNVINEDELEQTFNLNKATGFLVGSKLHKYWHIQTNTGTDFQEEFFISIFANLNYSWINFERVHSRLNNNFYNWGFGISFSYFINAK